MISILTLSYAVLVSFIILIVLTIWISFDAHHYKRNEKKKECFVRENSQWCYEYFIEGITVSRHIGTSKLEREAIVQILESYIMYVKDDAILQRIYTYMNRYYGKVYKKMLKSKNGVERTNALYYILDFHIVDALPTVERRLRKGRLSRKERLESLKIIAKLEEHKIDSFFEQYREQLTEKECFTIANQLKDDTIYDIVNGEHADDPWLLAALQVMYTRQLTYAQVAVHCLLQHPNERVREVALYLLTIIGTDLPLQQFESYFYSEDASKRYVFTNLMAYYDVEDTYSYLLALIQDRDFNVRQAAVQTVATYAQSERIFERMLREMQDMYAIEAIDTFRNGVILDGTMV